MQKSREAELQKVTLQVTLQCAAGTLHSGSRKTSGILGNDCSGTSGRQGFLSRAPCACCRGHSSSTGLGIGAGKPSWEPLLSRQPLAPIQGWALLPVWARVMLQSHSCAQDAPHLPGGVCTGSASFFGFFSGLLFFNE